MPEILAEAVQLPLFFDRGCSTCGYCLRPMHPGERECPACAPKLALVADVGSYKDFLAEMDPHRRARRGRS